MFPVSFGNATDFSSLVSSQVFYIYAPLSVNSTYIALLVLGFTLRDHANTIKRLFFHINILFTVDDYTIFA